MFVNLNANGAHQYNGIFHHVIDCSRQLSEREFATWLESSGSVLTFTSKQTGLCQQGCHHQNIAYQYATNPVHTNHVDYCQHVGKCICRDSSSWQTINVTAIELQALFMYLSKVTTSMLATKKNDLNWFKSSNYRSIWIYMDYLSNFCGNIQIWYQHCRHLCTWWFLTIILDNDWPSVNQVKQWNYKKIQMH